MTEDFEDGLRRLGLSGKEAKVYLALLERGRLTVPALIEITGVPRGTIYPLLTAMTSRGLVQVGAGYAGRYQALPPRQAVESLIRWDKEALAEREALAEKLAKELEPLAAKLTDSAVVERLEVLRDPRVISQRYEEILAATTKDFVALVKAPVVITATAASNKLQFDALRRGVRVRAVYERSALELPDVAPYLDAWIDAGEEARVYDGQLPHKLLVFDSRAAIIPVAATDSEASSSVVIRDEAVASGSMTLFESFWERARPLARARADARSARRLARV